MNGATDFHTSDFIAAPDHFSEAWDDEDNNNDENCEPEPAPTYVSAKSKVSKLPACSMIREESRGTLCQGSFEILPTQTSRMALGSSRRMNDQAANIGLGAGGMNSFEGLSTHTAVESVDTAPIRTANDSSFRPIANDRDRFRGFQGPSTPSQPSLPLTPRQDSGPRRSPKHTSTPVRDAPTMESPKVSSIQFRPESPVEDISSLPPTDDAETESRYAVRCMELFREKEQKRFRGTDHKQIFDILDKSINSFVAPPKSMMSTKFPASNDSSIRISAPKSTSKIEKTPRASIKPTKIQQLSDVQCMTAIETTRTPQTGRASLQSVRSSASRPVSQASSSSYGYHSIVCRPAVIHFGCLASEKEMSVPFTVENVSDESVDIIVKFRRKNDHFKVADSGRIHRLGPYQKKTYDACFSSGGKALFVGSGIDICTTNQSVLSTIRLMGYCGAPSVEFDSMVGSCGPIARIEGRPGEYIAGHMNDFTFTNDGERKAVLFSYVGDAQGRRLPDVRCLPEFCILKNGGRITMATREDRSFEKRCGGNEDYYYTLYVYAGCEKLWARAATYLRRRNLSRTIAGTDIDIASYRCTDVDSQAPLMEDDVNIFFTQLHAIRIDIKRDVSSRLSNIAGSMAGSTRQLNFELSDGISMSDSARGRR